MEKDLDAAQALFWQAAQEQSVAALRRQQAARMPAGAAAGSHGSSTEPGPGQAHRYYQDAGEHWASRDAS